MNTTTSFSELRKIALRIKDSIESGYLPSDYDKNETIILTANGYYAYLDNCVNINSQYYHIDEDSDEIFYDELKDEYILEDDAREVFSSINRSFFTHEDNCNSYNDIYYYEGDYITQDYMDSNGLVHCDGEIMHVDDCYYWESDCCWHSEPEENEEKFIQSYSYKPLPVFFTSKNENENVPFLGIELEVENKNDSISNDLMAENLQCNELYFKNDGSLSNGFEIVSHPMSFNYIKDNSKKFENMLNELKNNGFNSYDANTCGMHIHISKKSFGTWHFYRFLKFFNENREFIILISQRKFENLQKWANIENDSNDSLIYKAKKKNGNPSRYVAVNMSNSQTIEIRIFRGTLFFSSFMKNIEFVVSLFEFTRDCIDISLNSYKQYINGKHEFSNLKKFINLKKI